ncbi:MAG: hypothetical protein ACRDNE_07505 [Gaiellaceae bacterium]
MRDRQHSPVNTNTDINQGHPEGRDGRSRLRVLRRGSLLAAALLVAAASSAGNAPAAVPCFGAPAEYVAAFDTRDGRADGRVSYREPRVYLEVQGWLTKVGEAPGHHSEHVHSGTCFPQGQRWAPRVRRGRLDYRHVFHNVVGYKVVAVRGGFVDTGVKIKESAAQLAKLNAAAQRSAGTTVAVFQSYRLNFRRARTNGRKETRTGLDLRRSSSEALADRWFTSTGWQSYFAFRGKRKARPIRECDSIISRNWVTPFDYGNVGVGCSWRASRMDDAVPGSWRVRAGMASGVERASLHVDPDFHHHSNDPGIWSRSLSREGSVTIPTTGFPSGIHRVVYRGHEGAGSKITSTVITVIPFRVG